MKLVYALVICLTPLYAESQLYYQDFESADPFSEMTLYGTEGTTVAEQTEINDKGLADDIFWVVDETLGNHNALTTSRFSPPAISDNYLVTPLISIPSDSRYRISWDAASLGDRYHLDNYKVKISSTGIEKADFTTTVFHQYVGEPNGNGKFHQALIPESFNGEDIYIAFVSESYNGFMLSIDNISVMEVPLKDAAIIDLSIDELVAPGLIPIRGKIKNEGQESFGSYTIVWNDGSDHFESFDYDIPFDATRNFTHDIELDAIAENVYDITVCVLIDGDEYSDNDCLPFKVSAAKQTTDRLALLELFTSSTCYPCYTLNYEGYNGEGLNAGLADLNANSQIEAEIAVIKYQMDYPGVGDHAYNEDAQVRYDFYKPYGIPYTVLDGLGGGGVTPYWVGVAQDEPAFCKIEANHSTIDSELAVQVEITPYHNWEGATLHIALLDKAYENHAWLDPSFSNGENEFHHVLRKLIPSPEGTVIDLYTESVLTIEESYTYVFNPDMPEAGSYDLHANSEQEVVVFIQDSNGNLLNAAISVGDFLDNEKFDNEKFELALYPNPATNQTALLLNIDEVSEIQICLYSLTGELLQTIREGSHLPGITQIDIPIQDLGSGTYVVKSVINSKTSIQRLVVQ